MNDEREDGRTGAWRPSWDEGSRRHRLSTGVVRTSPPPGPPRPATARRPVPGPPGPATARRPEPELLTHRPPVLGGLDDPGPHRQHDPASDATRRTELWRRIRRASYLLVGLAVLGPVLAFVVGYLVFAVPSPDDGVSNQIYTVTFADGSSLARVSPSDQGNRIKTTIDKVPRPVQFAVLSAEDRSFYSNPGFDLVGIARAAWSQLRGGTGGGSTITQQYVKKTLVGDQHSLWRKYKEVVIATKISKSQTKEQILENYLNTVYFGRGAYGIEAASQAYFGKTVDKISPSEGALLAGLVQSPSRWDPAINPAKAQERWNYVLDGMVSQGWLPAADRARAAFPATLAPKPSNTGVPDDARGHIVAAVQDELAQHGISQDELNQEGLQITTTINPALQQAAVDAAHRQMAGQPANLRTALVSVDPRTGAVLAYYGGDNGSGFDYAQAQKQPGSSFKPFVLLAALEHNPPIGLGATYDGTSPQTIAGTKVANSDGESCGVNCDLRTAMTESVNTVFYHLGIDVGPRQVAAAARQAGIAVPLPNPTGGIALGDKEVRSLDMASAYATFAANGVYHAPHLITKVVAADGRVLYQPADAGEQRISAEVARNVTESLLDVADHSRIPLSSGRPVAAKTGTVQSHVEGQNNDAWTIGYTPSVSTAVWVGTDDNSPIKDKNGRIIYGRALPGSIWQMFMNAALKGVPEESFGPFVPLGEAPPDTSTAFPTGPAAADTRTGSPTVTQTVTNQPTDPGLVTESAGPTPTATQPVTVFTRPTRTRPPPSTGQTQTLAPSSGSGPGQG